MTQPLWFHDGSTSVVVIDTTAHVLRRSSSRYHLHIRGARHQYCCQDGCNGYCDNGVTPSVKVLVEKAKQAGATEVVVRTGQGDKYAREIHGLPVRDVSGVPKTIAEGIFIAP